MLVSFTACFPALALAQSGKPHATTGPPQKPPSILATQQRAFTIPFTTTANSQIVEVVLMVSDNGGKQWKEVARQNPSQPNFPFECQADGEYWFALQTKDRNGQTSPEKLKPELRIVVDTEKPLFEFQARSDAAGRVVGQWTASDPYLDPNTLQIRYQVQSDNPTTDSWIEVPTQSRPLTAQGLLQDQLAWWPQVSSRNIRIQAQIRDRAGNTSVVDRRMELPLVAQRFAPSTPPPIPAAMVSQKSSAAAEQNAAAAKPARYQPAGIPAALADLVRDFTSGAKASSVKRAPPASTPPLVTTTASQRAQPQPPLPPSRVADRSSQSAPPTSQGTGKIEPTTWRSRAVGDPQAAQIAVNSTDRWLPRDAKGGTANASGSNPEPTTVAQVPTQRQAQVVPAVPAKASASSPLPSDTTRPPANSGHAASPPYQANTAGVPSSNVLSTASTAHRDDPSPLPAPPKATMGMTSGPKFEDVKRMARHSNSLRFQVAYDIDAVGPEGVRSVELWMTPDGGNLWRRWTTDPDQRSPVDVEMTSEGIFGFRIVVISNEGLRTKSPRRGDPADIWVNVDTTKPDARIIAAPYGRGPQAGTLLIQWQASDANMALRPINLQFSPRSTGPWTTIENGVRNVGEFAWKPTLDIPDQVFLRLEARDAAGNTQVHQLERPVDVSGLIPRGHIRGITPLSTPASDKDT